MSGLTIQTGPWKNAKTQINREKIWSGGGVPSGGRAHAGNGNWRVVMDPSQMSSFSYDKGFPKPSKYSNPLSVVTKKAKIPFQKIPKAPINYLKEIATTLEEQNILIKKQIGIETPTPTNVDLPNIKHSELLNERPGNRRFGTNTDNAEVQRKQQSYGSRFVPNSNVPFSEEFIVELKNKLKNFQPPNSEPDSEPESFVEENNKLIGDIEGNPNSFRANTDLEEFYSKGSQNDMPSVGFSPVSTQTPPIPQVSETDILYNGETYPADSFFAKVNSTIAVVTMELQNTIFANEKRIREMENFIKSSRQKAKNYVGATTEGFQKQFEQLTYAEKVIQNLDLENARLRTEIRDKEKLIEEQNLVANDIQNLNPAEILEKTYKKLSKSHGLIIETEGLKKYRTFGAKTKEIYKDAKDLSEELKIRFEIASKAQARLRPSKIRKKFVEEEFNYVPRRSRRDTLRSMGVRGFI